MSSCHVVRQRTPSANTSMSVLVSRNALHKTILRLRVLRSPWLILLAALTACNGPGIPELNEPLPVTIDPRESFDFESLGSGVLVFDRTTLNREASGYMIVDADQRRASGVDFEIFSFYHALSPDGRYLAFAGVGSWPTGLDIHLFDRVTETVHRLSGDAEEDTWPSFQSSDVIFYHQTRGDTTRILRTGRTAEAGQGSEVLVLRSSDTTRFAIEGRISVAGDGRLTFANGTNSIYTYDPDSASLSVVYTTGRALYAPTWSSDGQRIAFLETAYENGTYQGTAVRILTPTTGALSTPVVLPGAFQPSPWVSDYSVAWCSGGTQLAFTAENAQLHTHVWLVDANGGPARQFTHFPAHHENVSCSR